MVCFLSPFLFLQHVRADISQFWQQLRFEVARKDFNTAVKQSEITLRSSFKDQTQVVEVLDLNL